MKAKINSEKLAGAKPCHVKNKFLAEKTIEDVLLHFGETREIARRRYRQFVKNGVDQENRPELQRGGLVRSAGGNKAGLLGRRKEEREKGDERILGSGNFVNEALMKAGEDWEKGKKKETKMAEITLKTNDPGKVVGILFKALDLEAKRLQYSLGLAKQVTCEF